MKTTNFLIWLIYSLFISLNLGDDCIELSQTDINQLTLMPNWRMESNDTATIIKPGYERGHGLIQAKFDFICYNKKDNILKLRGYTYIMDDSDAKIISFKLIGHYKENRNESIIISHEHEDRNRKSDFDIEIELKKEDLLIFSMFSYSPLIIEIGKITCM